MPADLDSVLRERLQSNDKQEAIELYYELLSSGHSVGEILDTLGPIQGKSESGNITIAEHPPSEHDGTARAVTSEAALAGTAQAAAPLDPENRRIEDRIEEPPAEESTSLNECGPGDREQLPGENLPGSSPVDVESASVHTASGAETAIPSSNQEPLQPGRFSNSAKRIAFGALYTAAVASVSIAGFALVSGGRNADPGTARIHSGTSSGTQAAAIPGSRAGRPEVVVAIPKSNEQAVNTNTPPVPEPSRSYESGSAVPGPPQRNTTEAPATVSASRAHIGHAAEPGRQVQASAINNFDAVGSGTGRSGNFSAPPAKAIDGQQIVRAFYTALERGDGEAASSLVIPEKREAGPFSAGALSTFYSRLELPFRLISVHRAGEDLYDVTYSYKVRNGRLCKGRSLVRTKNLQNRILIETIQSPSRC